MRIVPRSLECPSWLKQSPLTVTLLLSSPTLFKALLESLISHVADGVGAGEAELLEGDGLGDADVGVGDGVADGVALADADAATCAFLLASCERCAIPITAAIITPMIRAKAIRNAVTLPASRSRFLRVTFRSARRSRCSVSFSQAACFSVYPRTRAAPAYLEP